MSPALRLRERLESQPKPPIPTLQLASNLGEDHPSSGAALTMTVASLVAANVAQFNQSTNTYSIAFTGDLGWDAGTSPSLITLYKISNSVTLSNLQVTITQ